MIARRTLWAALIAAAVVLCGMLGLYGTSQAAPRRVIEPFANSVQQRIEMINHLKEIATLLKEQNTLLKQQNTLLRSGKLKVVVGQANKH